MIPARIAACVLVAGATTYGGDAGLAARQRGGTPLPYVEPQGQRVGTEKHAFTVDVVTGGLETPWALAWLPDGRALITERPGRLRVLQNGRLSDPVKGIPAVHEQQDGGMFDVEVHPGYATNGWIYLAYSERLAGFTPPVAEPDPAGAVPAGRGRGRGSVIPSMTVIVRGRLSPNLEWIDQQVIFRATPDMYTTSGSHFGCRLTFDRTGRLLFSLGDRGLMQDAQNLSKATGKIHRVNDDGTAPPDNPLASQPGAQPTIWTLGHRNPQGFAWDPVTGRLWSSEHGPNGGDEVNVITGGHNYGWSVVTSGTQNGVTGTTAPGMDDPVVVYTPSIGPTGMAFYTGDRFPAWKNTSLFVSGLVGQQLRRLEVKDGAVSREEVLFNQFGRVRDIAQGPDGYLYVLLQAPTGAGTGLSLAASTAGTLVRLVPAP